jgi:hypothetical protein
VPGFRGQLVRLRQLTGRHEPCSASWPLIPFRTEDDEDEDERMP